MPIYEFRCKACERKTSVFVRTVTTEPKGSCEHCGSVELVRLFSRVAVMRGDDRWDSTSRAWRASTIATRDLWQNGCER